MAGGASYCIRCGGPLSTARIEGRERGRCDRCEWVWWDPARPVVLVLAVTPTGRVVLTRDTRFPPGKWGLVAGYIEQDETAEAAALRELLEEAGMEGEEPRVVGTLASGGNLLVCVRCAIPDGDIGTAGHTEMERSMSTEVELVVPDLGRIVPASSASRLIERFLAGDLTPQTR